LNAAIAIEYTQRAERERVATQSVRERLMPLEERLSRLLATIPRKPFFKCDFCLN